MKRRSLHQAVAVPTLVSLSMAALVMGKMPATRAAGEAALPAEPAPAAEPAPTPTPTPNAETITRALNVMRQSPGDFWRGTELLKRARRVTQLLDAAGQSFNDIVSAAQALSDSADILNRNRDLETKLRDLVGDDGKSGELTTFQDDMIADPTKHRKWPVDLKLSDSDRTNGFGTQLGKEVKELRFGINRMLGNEKGSLPPALAKFYGRAHGVAQRVQTQLAAIKADSALRQAFTTDADTKKKAEEFQSTLKALNTRLPSLTAVHRATLLLVKAQQSAQDIVLPEMPADEKKHQTDFNAAVDELTGEGDKSVDNQIERVPKVLALVSEYLPDEVVATVQLAQKVSAPPLDLDPFLLKQKAQRLGHLHTLAANVNRLNVALSDAPNTYAASIKDNQTEIERQRLSRQLMADAIAAVDESMAGDMSGFEVRQVRLFYFSNAVQLIKALNPKAHPVDSAATEARVASRNAQRAVVQNQISLNEALGEVNDLSDALQRLRNALNQAETDQRRTQSTLKKQSSLLAAIGRRIDALPPETQSNAVKRTRKRAQLEEEQAVQTEAEKNAKDADDAAQKHLIELRGDFNTTQERERAALQALRDAQKTVRQTRERGQLAVLDDLQGFRERIDNPVVWFAPANAASTDAPRKVELYAFEDSATIYLRGNYSDVNRTREIIAEYDRPAPQALITLWTMQLNGGDAGKMSDATVEIEKLTNDLGRHLVEIQEELQGLIVAEVNRVAQIYSQKAVGRANIEGRMARYFFYAPEVRKQLGFPLDENCLDFSAVSGKAPSMGAMCPPPTSAALLDAKAVTNWTLPDPANVTTLGQSFFVLSLARRSSREIIAQQFRLVLLNSLRSLAREYPGTKAALTSASGVRVAEPYFPFSMFGSRNSLTGTLATYRDPNAAPAPGPIPTMDIGGRLLRTESAQTQDRYLELIRKTTARDPATLRADEEISGNQKEILLAIQVKARDGVTREIQWLLNEIRRPSMGEDLRTRLRQRYLPLVGWLASDTDMLPSEATTFLQSTSWTQLGLQATLPSSKFGEVQDKPLELALSALSSAQGQSMDKMALEITRSAESSNLLSRAVPRVAAADKMIKEMIRMAQSNLDTFLVQPSLIEMNRRVRSKGIKLGSLQRTTLLTTNRSLSRVDPSATASLQFESEVDILQGATQLANQVAQIKQYQAERKSASSTAGVLGTAGALLTKTTTANALGVGALLSILGGNAPAPPAPGDVYSVNTGNEWTVTPIFDPSGQAMRFKFDYNASVRVREPDGSVNPQLPRIERHTVNTEVGLNNLEFGEVSRFETNSKIGLPTRKTGGVPLLNQIPILKEIPLIGYFTRQKRQAAESQQSLIFAQTTMFPTVSDIVGLMVAPGRAASTLGGTERSEVNPDALFGGE